MYKLRIENVANFRTDNAVIYAALRIFIVRCLVKI